ncbi:MAG: hypothetical protein GTO41_29535 [Burkholderiales bacterium]|nr:hypothetical protein [Burkholderiales bacterium]
MTLHAMQAQTIQLHRVGGSRPDVGLGAKQGVLDFVSDATGEDGSREGGGVILRADGAAER